GMSSSVATSSPSTTQNRRWSIEKIVKHVIDKNGDRMKFFVQWEGYGRRFDSWEPFENIKTATTRLYEYYERIPEEEVKKIKQCRLMMKRAARALREGKSLTPQLLKKSKKRKVEEDGQYTPRIAKKRRDNEDEEGGEETDSMKRGRGRPRKDARERSSSTVSTQSVTTPASMKKVKVEQEELLVPGEEDAPSTSAGSLCSVSTPSRSRRVKVDGEWIAVAADECAKSKRTSIGENIEETDEKKDVKEEDIGETMADYDEATEDQILEETEQKEEDIDKIMEDNTRDEPEEMDTSMESADTPEEETEETVEANEQLETRNKDDDETEERPSTSAACYLSQKAETSLKSYRLDDYPVDGKKDAAIDENENPRVVVIGMEIGTVLSEDEEEIIVLRNCETTCQRPPILERRDKSKNEARRRKAERPEKIVRDAPDCEINVIKKKRGPKPKKKRGPVKTIKTTKDDSPPAGSVFNSPPSVIAAPTIDQETKGKKIEKMEMLMREIVEKKRRSDEFNEKEGEREKSEHMKGMEEEEKEKEDIAAEREKSEQLMEMEGEEKEKEDIEEVNDVPEEKEEVVNVDEAVDDNKDDELTEETSGASDSLSSSGRISKETIEEKEVRGEMLVYETEEKEEENSTPEMVENEDLASEDKEEEALDEVQEAAEIVEQEEESEWNEKTDVAVEGNKNEEREEKEETETEVVEEDDKLETSGTGSGLEDVPEYLEEERAGPSTSSGLVLQPRTSRDPSDEEQEDVDLPDVIPDPSADEKPIIEMKEEMMSDGEHDNYVELVRGGEAERSKRMIKKRQVFSPSR
ncbi:hypothetical protein PENTCL1PPCAC_30005, partial [Pristionchus entomophagus]